MTNWVTSDTHFFHKNVIKYCNRPFQDVDEMGLTMLYNWNYTVEKEDTVYFLGDWAFGNRKELGELLLTLNGKIIMIRGNHDKQTVTWYKRYGIAEVHGGEYWEYEPNVLLSHRPYPTKFPRINIHGHIHNNLMEIGPKNLYANVCVEVTNYTPVDLDELIRSLRER